MAQIRRTDEARAWMDGDTDRDGLALRADEDADGDGMDWTTDPDSDGDGQPDGADIVAAARALAGPTDPLMGGHGDPLGALGARVCIDVVMESWLAAGRPLAERLRARASASASAAPSWFQLDRGNLPGDPFFVRRTRNLRDLFAHDPALVLDETPQPGDVAFYGRFHSAIVVEAGAHYRVVEAAGLWVGEVAGRTVAERTGERAVFGAVRGSPRKPTAEP